MKRIFEARCPKCQHIHFVSHPFLYRDDEKKILYVLANENTDVDAFVKKILKQLNKNLGAELRS